MAFEHSTRPIWILPILATFAVACGARSPAPVPPPPLNDTTLGSGDVFQVRVFGEKELSNSYRVAEDGTIDFPLIGAVEVAGLEPPAVASVISNRLRTAGILRAPQVSVLVEEYNSKRISVLGAVSKPGTFPMSAGMTVVQAISLAGGFTPLANQDDTVVTRRLNGELRRFRVPVEKISEGRSSDFPVRAGDIVYVPERIF